MADESLWSGMRNMLSQAWRDGLPNAESDLLARQWILHTYARPLSQSWHRRTRQVYTLLSRRLHAIVPPREEYPRHGIHSQEALFMSPTDFHALYHEMAASFQLAQSDEKFESGIAKDRFDRHSDQFVTDVLTPWLRRATEPFAKHLQTLTALTNELKSSIPTQLLAPSPPIPAPQLQAAMDRLDHLRQMQQQAIAQLQARQLMPFGKYGWFAPRIMTSLFDGPPLDDEESRRQLLLFLMDLLNRSLTQGYTQAITPLVQTADQLNQCVAMWLKAESQRCAAITAHGLDLARAHGEDGTRVLRRDHSPRELETFMVPGACVDAVIQFVCHHPPPPWTYGQPRWVFPRQSVISPEELRQVFMSFAVDQRQPRYRVATWNAWLETVKRLMKLYTAESIVA